MLLKVLNIKAKNTRLHIAISMTEFEMEAAVALRLLLN
jgi:hypothetical protein